MTVSNGPASAGLLLSHVLAHILVSMGNIHWTSEEDAWLREHAPVMSCAQMAQELGRSTKAVWSQCSKLGLSPVDGRSRQAIQVETGQEFGRLTVLEVGYSGGRRAARVSCSGPHAPVEKWVQLSSLASGAVKSCGCLNREVASSGARTRNEGNKFAAKPAEEHKPGYVPTVRLLVDERGVRQQHQVDEDGRECSKCETYKSWSEFAKGNGARGHLSLCKQCQREHYQSGNVELRREQAVARRLKVFGLTPAQYRAMEAVYGGRCWLCKNFETVKGPGGHIQRLGVDHDHNCCNFDPTPSNPLCGECIRGLCCVRCNRRVLGEVDAVGPDKVFSYLGTSHDLAKMVIAAA